LWQPTSAHSDPAARHWAFTFNPTGASMAGKRAHDTFNLRMIEGIEAPAEANVRGLLPL
jgi:hypothetical protein